MFKLSRFRRPRRAGEWRQGKVVTFIVTLAAHRNVTLAAACLGMSRKSAYALKHRDSGFAAAWDAAVAAGALPMRKEPALNSIQGDKGDEPHNPGGGVPLGYAGPGAETRELSFEEMLRRLRDSGPRPLARSSTLA